MVQRLKEFGIEKNYFKYKNLFEVSDKTCCDALLINNSITFIEFKSFKDVKKYEKENSNEKEDFFLNDIKDSLVNKIDDSLWILDYIVRHKNFSMTKENKKIYKTLEKNYYIVPDVDIKPIEQLQVTLNLLASGTTNIYDNLISVTSQIVDNMEIYELNKPQLIDCDKLKELST